MKTTIAKPEQIQATHQFHLIDAEGEILGRLATKVATLLTGKHKPIYTPFLDTGDHVIIVNAEKIRLTGKKMNDKLMIHYTGYPGGLRKKNYEKAIKDNPVRVIEKAVWGMMPKNRLGRKMIKKLRVYKGSEHPHAPQKPVFLEK
ncbi:MAG: 50S ribosomal protein L13 [Candidatus Omnitrophota bacterium]|jgi:large subunit ribosomal protein L13|nr:MAG: 50S ribosomal protein L13 [Candidatus Omnitrophota bacterium]